MDERFRTFGDFELDLQTGELRRHGVPVPLQRQPARVLAALVAHAGELVTRHRLRAAVWGDATHVDFNRGLNYCIRHLRAALDDDARAPRYIETVARQGYRFVAPVTCGARRRIRQPRRTLALAVMAAVVVIAAAVESSGRNETHHAIGVAVARAVHDLLF